MSRERGTGYIPDKSNLMSSTLAMLKFSGTEKNLFSIFIIFKVKL